MTYTLHDVNDVFIVKCEYISNFVLVVADFEQVNICWVHIENTNTLEDLVYHALCFSSLSVKKVYEQIAFELISSQPYEWVSEKILQRNELQTLILAKIDAAHIQNDLLCICLFTDFARWKTVWTYLTQLILSCSKLLLSC